MTNEHINHRVQFRAAPCTIPAFLHTAGGRIADAVPTIPVVRVAAKDGFDTLNAELDRHPAWRGDFELLDAATASRGELEGLLATAPSVYLKGFCYGQLTLMMAASSSAGRSYERSGEASEELRAALSDVQQRMGDLNGLRGLFGDWLNVFEHTDLDTCTRVELEELTITAPCSLFEGYLFGKFVLRQGIAGLTGRRFI